MTQKSAQWVSVAGTIVLALFLTLRMTNANPTIAVYGMFDVVTYGLPLVLVWGGVVWAYWFVGRGAGDSSLWGRIFVAVITPSGAAWSFIFLFLAIGFAITG